MLQNRPNARLRDPDRPILAPRRQLSEPDVPLAHRVIPQTRDAFLRLARAVVRHGTMVQHMGEEATSMEYWTRGFVDKAAGVKILENGPEEEDEEYVVESYLEWAESGRSELKALE